MIDMIGRVNPNYQKAVDAVSATKAAEKAQAAGETQEEAAKQPDLDAYAPGDKAQAEEDAGTAYKPNAALVKALKEEQAANQQRFIDRIKSMLNKQGKVFGESTDYTVDPEVQAAAQEAISENGYWGVRQTSERMVSFARALVGGDPGRAGEMRDAFIKGYGAAGKAWGGALPSIAEETYDASMKLFDEWEKEGAEEDGAAAEEDGASGTEPEGDTQA